jgi:hypothetical protein
MALSSPLTTSENAQKIEIDFKTGRGARGAWEFRLKQQATDAMKHGVRKNQYCDVLSSDDPEDIDVRGFSARTAHTFPKRPQCKLDA